ncbi:hypothetical protein LCGC14_0235770 [marine sediment metagenome]|uniref:Uncharacterized protein n=1 Tax=marine sediment metagenome TaxID=412755 RepID=A0A0F9WTT5_9ZZZZ
MAAITGYKGTVDFGVIIDSDLTYNCYSWSLDLTGDMVDTTNFSSTGWRNFTAGLKGWTGTIELYVDSTQKIQPSDVGSTAVLRLYFSDTTEGLTGNAICNGWSPAVAVDGVQTQTVTFQGTSDLSRF